MSIVPSVIVLTPFLQIDLNPVCVSQQYYSTSWTAAEDNDDKKVLTSAAKGLT